ncbi:hypothetical protein NW760_008956 [Fusarium oxysporum]|nr:hypothetical protein NW760_008956 [Fusarium oxysporum]
MVSSGCHFSQGTRKTLIFNINVEPEGMTDIKPHFGKIPACDYCRSKKLRCSKERPRCMSCTRSGRPCRYSERTQRTPLTRDYLTRVERRLANVERLFGQLLPDVDINEALASQGVEAPADASQPNASLSPPTNPTSPHSPVQVGGAISDAVPAESDGFDWQEDVDELTDGMASLSVEPRGAGYLGKSVSPDINTQNIDSH